MVSKNGPENDTVVGGLTRGLDMLACVNEEKKNIAIRSCLSMFIRKVE
jgi:hypothetical protein